MKRQILPLFFWLSILTTIAIISGSTSYFPFSFEKESVHTANAPLYMGHLANFDGVHYQNISQLGYITPFQTAFFPLYPLLIHLLGLLLANNNLLAAVLISLSCLIASILLLKKLFSFSVVVALVSFPTAFFLVSGYTESLFLFLSLLVWFLYIRRQFFLSALVGVLLSATRFYGILLLPIIFIDYFLSLKKNKRRKVGSYLALLPYSVLPLGLLFYMYYLATIFHNPLQFISALSMWHKSEMTVPFQTIFRYIKIFISASPKELNYHIALLEFLSLLYGLFASFTLFRYKKVAFSIYVLAGSLIPTLSGTLQSMPRYLLGMFPIFLVPRYWKISRYAAIILVSISFVIQFSLFYLFLTGHFVS